MAKILLVGIGGFVGSILRYLVSSHIQQFTKGLDFPYGTLVVNLIGCFLIGLLSELISTDESQALVLIGFLGGFTTFSTFSHESLNLLANGKGNLALLNISIQVIMGMAAVWLGRAVSMSR
ncbi:MAG: fluoride efflux transporter CrcB [Pseudanabaenaceae cyanobacterium bins.68]|nr:fluoride efflux transporter CrcB [Pseudanabaenaceae cyanobacterium bins.68]